jgi:hypothetical protein
MASAGAMADGKEPGAGRSPRRESIAQARLSRRLLSELRHRADLALFADEAPPRWTDALLAETRFQIAGTMNAMEMAIRLEIADRDLEDRLARIGQPYCSLALERQVELLSPELLSHYRLRGALAVVLRERYERSGAEEERALLDSVGEGPFAQTLAALALAEQRWCGPLLLDAPLRPDLPAEHYCDLAWTAAALLIRGLSEPMATSDRAAMHAIIHAVERVIARHDEGGGPFALAQRCARALSNEERLRLAPQALIERRLLFFCALVEAETALPIDDVLGAIIDGIESARHAILRLMGMDEVLAVQVFEMLAPLTGGSGEHDIALASFVEAYRRFDLMQAEAWLTQMLVPSALVAKLTMIEPAP